MTTTNEAREAQRWEQIADRRNVFRFTPQTDPQYNAILAAGDFAATAAEYAAAAGLNKGSTLALDEHGNPVHVTQA